MDSTVQRSPTTAIIDMINNINVVTRHWMRALPLYYRVHLPQQGCHLYNCKLISDAWLPLEKSNPSAKDPIAP